MKITKKCTQKYSPIASEDKNIFIMNEWGTKKFKQLTFNFKFKLRSLNWIGLPFFSVCQKNLRRLAHSISHLRFYTHVQCDSCISKCNISERAFLWIPDMENSRNILCCMQTDIRKMRVVFQNTKCWSLSNWLAKCSTLKSCWPD